MKKEVSRLFISIAVIFSVMFLTIALTSKMVGWERVDWTIPEGTHKDCLKGALAAREAFENTKFSDWNFYQTCVLNVECSSPITKCPHDKIHEQSKFFTEKQ